jgi:hypothetical protein
MARNALLTKVGELAALDDPELREANERRGDRSPSV